jgi:hypothetical protein
MKPWLESTFRVGEWRCTITVREPAPDEVGLYTVDWSPTSPPTLDGKLLEQYERGRDMVLNEASRLLDLARDHEGAL